jgi:hypothetical protein
VLPSASCSADGNTNFHTPWAVETNYYMDLGFLPESIRYFEVGCRAGWYGPPTCNLSPGVSNNSGSEQSASAGITVKFERSLYSRRKRMAPRCPAAPFFSLSGLKPGRLFLPDASVQRFRFVLEQRSEDLSGSLTALEHLAAG